MPKPKKGARLGGSPAHQRLILRNLATSLFQHGAVTTTEAKARALRPYAEKLITKARKGDLHNRRLVMRELYTSVDQRQLEEDGVLAVNQFPQHRRRPRPVYPSSLSTLRPPRLPAGPRAAAARQHMPSRARRGPRPPAAQVRLRVWAARASTTSPRRAAREWRATPSRSLTMAPPAARGR